MKKMLLGLIFLVSMSAMAEITTLESGQYEIKTFGTSSVEQDDISFNDVLGIAFCIDKQSLI